jgi:hypothetical protein
MKGDKKIFLLQYIEIFCMFFSACAAMIGFYFGIRLIFENVAVDKGIIQCIITFMIFIILIILAFRSIKSLKKHKKNTDLLNG